MAQAFKYNHELNIDYKKIVDEFLDDKFELSDVKMTNINFKEIYNKNIELIKIEDLQGNTEYLSLLYFEDKLNEIKEYIESIKITETTDTGEEPTHHPKPIIDVTPVSPPPSTGPTRKPRKPYKHPGGDGGKKERGNKSEQSAYDSLISEHGKESVVWVSLDDDSLGYDMKYKNKEGEWRYVEVKTHSGKQFYISRNEKQFAEEHFGLYEIFLVGNEIYKFTDVDFTDTSIFQLRSKDFIVEYKID